MCVRGHGWGLAPWPRNVWLGEVTWLFGLPEIHGFPRAQPLAQPPGRHSDLCVLSCQQWHLNRSSCLGDQGPGPIKTDSRPLVISAFLLSLLLVFGSPCRHLFRHCLPSDPHKISVPRACSRHLSAAVPCLTHKSSAVPQPLLSRHDTTRVGSAGRLGCRADCSILFGGGLGVLGH